MLEELTPRERRYQRTQQAILDAARALLAEGGADKLSMRAIADRIDYSPAGLYEYYGSKEEIIGAVCRQGHRTLKQYMAKVPLTLPPDLYIVEIGLAYIEFAMQNPDYFLLIFTAEAGQLSHDESSKLPSPEMLNDDSSFPILLRGIQRGVDAGIIGFLPGQGLIQTAYALWSIVHGASMLRVGYLSTLKVNFEETDRLMLAAFIDGLRQTP